MLLRRTRPGLILAGIALLVAAIGVAHWLTATTGSQSVFVNEPVLTRTLPLYGSVIISQEFTVPGASISGLRLFMNTLPAAGIHGERITLELARPDSKKPLRTVTLPLAEAISEEVIRHHTPEQVLELATPTLYFPFSRVATEPQEKLIFTVSVPTVDRENALGISYQADDGKYPNAQLTYDDAARAGDVGFVLYENPTRSQNVFAWLTNPQHRVVWLGSLIVLAGLAGLVWQRHTSQLSPVPFWDKGWKLALTRRSLITGVLLSCAVAALYWPATKAFFVQDDIQKLLRAKYYSDEPVRLFFSNHRYELPEHPFATPVGFYRPVSVSFYSWLNWHSFGLNPFGYHLLNIAWLCLLTFGIYISSVLLFRSVPLALLAASVFAAHSTKLDLVYWWSSSEDLIGNFFLLLCLLLYTYWRRFQAAPVAYWLMVASFALAILSKEHTIILLPVLALLEMADVRSWRQLPRRASVVFHRLSPLLIIIGVYLIARTIALYDPALPIPSQIDHSYDLKLSPAIISRNTLIYSTWTAENWLWAKKGGLLELLAPLENPLQLWVRGIQAAPPYTPGIFIILFFLLLLALPGKTPARPLAMLAGIWWVLMLMPNLFIATAADPRWLTMSTWSVGILAVCALIYIFRTHTRPRDYVAMALSLLVLAYGAWALRLPERTVKYDSITMVMQEALAQFSAQAAQATPDSLIYFVDIPYDMRGSVNPYLLRLFYPTEFKKAVYTETMPESARPHDIVINARHTAL